MKRIRIFILLSLGGIFYGNTYGQIWKSYSDSAKQMQEENKLNEALHYYQLAKQLLEKDSLPKLVYSQACKKVADTYSDLDQREKILMVYQEARDIVKNRAGRATPSYIQLTDFIGTYYLSASLVNAEKYFVEALELRKNLYTKESLEYAIGCNYLGGFYAITGKYESAAEYHLEAKRIRENNLTKTHRLYAQSCNNLANAYWNMGEYEKAELLALEAKAIREKIPPEKKSRDYAFTCANLGNIYRDMGQYEKAESYYRIAKDIRQNSIPKDEAGYSEILNSLGDIYYYMNQYEKAEPLFLEAKRISNHLWGDTSNKYALSCNNLASLYSDMRRFKESEELFLQALNIWNSTLKQSDPTNAMNRNGLGSLYLKMGDYLKAKYYFNEAHQLWDSVIGKNHPYYTQNMYQLARVYWNSGQITNAQKMYDSGFFQQYNQINKFFRFTNDYEKQQFLNNIISSADENLSFYYQNQFRADGGQAYNITILSRSLVLASSAELKQIVFRGDSDLKKSYKEWVAVKQRLANLYLTANGSSEEQMETLEEKADSIESILSRSSAALRNTSKERPDWKILQKKLLPSEAAIEFAGFRYFNGQEWSDSILYVALILRNDRPLPRVIPLFEEKQLDSLGLNGNSQMQEVISSFYTRGAKLSGQKNYSKTAYQLIWQPIEPFLKGIRTIYFTPAGKLHKVSFAALPITKTKVLSDMYDLVQLSSTSELLINKSNNLTENCNFSLYGGIRYDQDSTPPGNQTKTFPFLPGTKQEVVSIERMAKDAGISVLLDTGYNATESSIKKLDGYASPEVLHIATHGFYLQAEKEDIAFHTMLKPGGGLRKSNASDNPLLRSGLLFAGAEATWDRKISKTGDDGILSAYEVSGMYLPNTKLVVLSACETALGDIRGNEGVFGLQRAFKMAGAHYLLMSLWQVPDAEAAEFMEQFYSALIKNKSIKDSFLKAREALKNKYRNQSFKWASWVLIR